MAITNNGTKVSVPSGKIPTGYSLPSVTTFTDFETVYENRVITIAKSTIENASASTAFTALVAAVDSAVDSLLANDFVATNTVTAYADFVNYTTNQTVNDGLFTTDAENFLCTVNVYVKTA